MNEIQRIDPSRKGDRRVLLLSIFAAAFIFFGRFGYDVGAGDQDEFLPLLVRRLTNDVLLNDWFVNAQLDAFSIRLPLVIVLQPVSSVLGVTTSVLLVYVCAFIMIAVAVHLLVRTLFESELAALISTVSCLGVTKLWTLGGNDIITSMLVPSMIAWAFALWAFLWMTREKPGRAGLLCGLSILFQPLVGIHMTLLCSGVVMICLWLDSSRSMSIRRVLSSLRIPVLAFAAGSPVLLSILLDQVQEPLSPESMAIFTSFRAPHHFLPDAFNSEMAKRFLFLALLGIGGSRICFTRMSRRARSVLFSALILTSLALGGAYINEQYLHISNITKLQLFKYSVTGKLLLVIIISGIITEGIIPHRYIENLSRWSRHPRAWKSVAFAFILLVLGAVTYAPLTIRNLPFLVRNDSPDAELYAWIKSNTPVDAIFAVPPDHSGFQYHSSRAQYVNFKAFPYHEQDIREWYRRITTQSPLPGASITESTVSFPQSRGTSGLHDLVLSYASADDLQLYKFATQESVHYLLRRRAIENAGAPGPVTEVFSNPQWYLYLVTQTK